MGLTIWGTESNDCVLETVVARFPKCQAIGNRDLGLLRKRT